MACIGVEDLDVLAAPGEAQLLDAGDLGAQGVRQRFHFYRHLPAFLRLIQPNDNRIPTAAPSIARRR